MAGTTVIAVDGWGMVIRARRTGVFGGPDSAVMRMLQGIAMAAALHDSRHRGVASRRDVHCMLAERHRDRGVTLDGQPDNHE